MRFAIPQRPAWSMNAPTAPPILLGTLRRHHEIAGSIAWDRMSLRRLPWAASPATAGSYLTRVASAAQKGRLLTSSLRDAVTRQGRVSAGRGPALR